MKILKNLMVLFVFLSIGLLSGTIYASDLPEEASNVKVETVVQEDGKEVKVAVSEDEYVRITLETNINTSTFESKVKIMGETKQGTDVVIEVYNTKAENISGSKDVTIYKLKTVGITESFNQLIELLEGENKVVLKYTNEEDKKDEEEMIFYFTRLSEEKKEYAKTMTVNTGAKESSLERPIKTDALK